ncbi:hypothetical protein J6590_081376 [Homalodisca vitripennis]|nr:hypothetical protein J6590_081376 [Homalodisca vitripennis]
MAKKLSLILYLGTDGLNVISEPPQMAGRRAAFKDWFCQRRSPIQTAATLDTFSQYYLVELKLLPSLDTLLAVGYLPAFKVVRARLNQLIDATVDQDLTLWLDRTKIRCGVDNSYCWTGRRYAMVWTSVTAGQDEDILWCGRRYAVVWTTVTAGQDEDTLWCGQQLLLDRTKIRCGVDEDTLRCGRRYAVVWTTVTAGQDEDTLWCGQQLLLDRTKIRCGVDISYCWTGRRYPVVWTKIRCGVDNSYCWTGRRYAVVWTKIPCGVDEDTLWCGQQLLLESNHRAQRKKPSFQIMLGLLHHVNSNNILKK